MEQPGTSLLLPEPRPLPFLAADPAWVWARAFHLARPVLAALMLIMLASITPPFPFGSSGGTVPDAASPGTAGTPPALAIAANPADILPLAPVEAIVVNAKRPFDGRLEAIAPFRFGGADTARARAVDCLAAAAWYEAGDDPRGERAVIQVVLNRARHPSYPKTVCGVVFEGSERRTGCQFTFTCDGALARIPSPAAWQRARQLAEAALAGAVDATVGGATHYHADYVVPRWAPKLEKLAQVGAHIFYRFPGSWGRQTVFRPAGDRPEPAIARLARIAPVHAGSELAEATTPETGLPELPATALAEAGSATRSLTFSARQPARDSAILVAIDTAAPAGRWAMQAMSRCVGKADCQVIAWGSPGRVEANRQRAPADRERPVFLFVRDRTSGMDVAMWDCAVAPRPDPSQCLPTDPAALKRLMRARPD